MKQAKSYFLVILLVLTGVTYHNAYGQRKKAKKEISTPSKPIIDFRTNEQYIDGLKQGKLDFNDPKEVFYALLQSLGDKAVVYPSEHYYYYSMNYKGRPISGCILFSQKHLDSNIVHFSFIEKYPHDNFNSRNTIGGSGKYDKSDGVSITSIGDTIYNVKYKDLSVDFHFYLPGLQPPTKQKITEDETFLCNAMDESGLKHALVYNEAVNSLYWVLNEDEMVLDTFVTYVESILIGKRTQFAYYNDTINNRKLLIGVEMDNVMNNNWFDGPFDQLPDTYIKLGKLDLKKYVDRVYGFPEDKIGKYLSYLNKHGRVAICPYMVYDDKKDLYTVLQAAKSIARNKNEFYRYLTIQHYKVPDEKLGF